ncbi:MAG TPA: ATP-binding protein [Woeseiaceae bacterium]|nr:ATP-binding protein [Woeseiaceae bacterium]
MLPHKLIKRFNQRSLAWLLLSLFLALAVPTTLLVWQAWTQLKWEAFHQSSGSAEELTNRIDSRLQEMVNSIERRSFADYSFLLNAGDSNATTKQRSPLSSYPVEAALPGLLGYFQVDTNGEFSTPLLPVSRSAASELGISASEYDKRLELAKHIRTVLAENRLVQSRPGPAAVQSIEESVAAPYAGAEEVLIAADKDAYSQQIFDELDQRRQNEPSRSKSAGAAAKDGARAEAKSSAQRSNTIGKVSDLKLDAKLQNKSEQIEREAALQKSRVNFADDAPLEVVDKKEAARPASAATRRVSADLLATASSQDRISTFESDIDSFTFSILGSGQFVLFRKIWHNGERYIQGLLIDNDAFLKDAVGTAFSETSLSSISNLIVAYGDDVIESYGARDATSRSVYSDVAKDLSGSLLYRSRLGAPLDSLELIYSVQRLPPGPGARILAWLTLILAVVFTSGFFILYRLGISQLRLAQQQQDFVSAVSHELKTPLTSIRMYGEMLKEGWADDSKRQSYYEFIHDEAERLSRLIANVLQLASITRDEPQCNPKPVLLGELMDNVESRISSQVERAGFALHLQRVPAAGQTSVDVDVDCFLQIVINLVDNAIKFSKNATDKSIDIECKVLGTSQVQFSIRDYGPGIPKDQMQKIFQLFYRTESELTRETVGTGIGLAIVHQLTLAMSGSVDVVNVGPGAEFRLLFPVSET